MRPMNLPPVGTASQSRRSAGPMGLGPPSFGHRGSGLWAFSGHQEEGLC